MDNNDISTALNKLLADPAALASAMSMASSLMGNLPQENSANAAESPSPAENKPPEAVNEAIVASSSVENDATPPLNSLAALAPLLASGKKNDPRCALLYALKPYMSHGRGDKIDTLVNLLKIADIAGGLLGGKLL